MELILLLALILFVPANAGAYIDPGLGSYIFQIIAVSFIGVAYFFRSSFLRVKVFFSRLFKKRTDKEDDDSKEKK